MNRCEENTRCFKRINVLHNVLRDFILLNVWCCCVVCIHCSLIRQPQDVAALIGEVITLECASDTEESIAWVAYSPGSSVRDYIVVGGSLTANAPKYISISKPGKGHCNLHINSSSRREAARRYICIEQLSTNEARAELILLESDPVCTMTPITPTELLYNQPVLMSCSISYTTDPSYLAANMIWSKDDDAASAVTSFPPHISTSANLTTAVSRIIQTPGNFTPFPIYRCNTTFKIIGNPPHNFVYASNSPDYSKSVSLFSSPINVIYLKPAYEGSISGARSGDEIDVGKTVTCKVEGNPLPNYSWLDVLHGNTTNDSSIQIWHSGEFQCTAWNRAANTSFSLKVKTHSALSEGNKFGLFVGIGVGGMLILGGIILAVLCVICKRMKRTKPVDNVAGRRHVTVPENTDMSRMDDYLNVLHYESLNALSEQQLNTEPGYEELPTMAYSYVDAQSVTKK